MPQLPGEQDLRTLARAFADAEARVRGLLVQALDGDRRDRATEALEGR